MINKYDYKLSLIRFISMILIFFCHIFQGLNSILAFWFNVGVSIFFFLSGYLCGKKEYENIKEFYFKKIIKIFFPLFILEIIVFLIMIFIKHFNFDIKFIIQNILGFGCFDKNFDVLSHTWFVIYIMFCYLITPLLQKIFEEKKSFLSNSILLCLILIFTQFLSIFKVTNFIPAWINNFIIGYFYTKICCTDLEKKKFHISLSAISLIVIPLFVIIQENINISLPEFIVNRGDQIIYYGHVFLGIDIFLLLYFIFSKIKISYNKLLKISDKYSYYFYLVHQIFILNYFSLLNVTKNIYINLFIIIIACIISSFLLSIIVNVIIKYTRIEKERQIL